jgi:hypothetical protein
MVGGQEPTREKRRLVVVMAMGVVRAMGHIAMGLSCSCVCGCGRHAGGSLSLVPSQAVPKADLSILI